MPDHAQGPRRGLVLGAGGVLGAAWTIGALGALEGVLGIGTGDVDVVVGTSAGSVLASFVASGVSTAQMVNHQRGILVEGDPRIEYDYDAEAALPPRPRMRVGSRRLLAESAKHPGRVTPVAALAALMPQGRGSLAAIGTLVDSVEALAVAEGRFAARGWPTEPTTWIVAMDYETGRRVPFGRPGAPTARLSQAVRASCAIPGWYTPVTIDGHRYVDGGACSATSLDLLTPLGLDEVYVLAPMASFSYDKPRSAIGKLERRVRRGVTRRLLREAQQVRASGTRVTLVGPGPEDLQGIGANLMDASRRENVFETSLRTTADALRHLRGPVPLAVAG